MGKASHHMQPSLQVCKPIWLGVGGASYSTPDPHWVALGWHLGVDGLPHQVKFNEP